ncbi:hypothetical protein E7T06_07255 [Deinococcus sp. Arct2-2]|uniref:hypothetical protein n=1 Tax=Deinococcus sp. Arct2-2 TaxID=2568653 RepID=UPI0010A48B35|nr:hypothetical protein [Deinococcus sp. Arct2-2]THF70494.1 hypothetical protein E7T06_07255 [Deinococcus sp. Arct2-2]
MHKQTFSRSLFLTAALSLASLMPRAEGNEPDEATKARNLQSLLDKKNGDSVALAAQLLAENNEARETIRTQRADLQKLQVPEGGVVLTKEQAAAWAEYQAHGTPAEVKTKIETGAAAIGERDTLKQEKALTSVAEAAGYKPRVLGDRLTADKLTPEVREIDQDGKKVKVVYVKGEDNKEHLLSEYAKANWEDYLPALTAQGSGTGNEQQQNNVLRVALGGNGSSATTTRTPEQIAADKKSSGDYSM